MARSLQSRPGSGHQGRRVMDRALQAKAVGTGAHQDPGGNIWSALDPPNPSKPRLTMALTQPRRHARGPGWETLPKRCWRLPSALRQMLKHVSEVLPACCGARALAKPTSMAGDRQVPAWEFPTRTSMAAVRTSLPAPSRDRPGTPEQPHAARVLLNTNVRAAGATHVSE